MSAQEQTNPDPDTNGMRITRLPRNGPRPGQTTNAWLYGKQRAMERLVDDPRAPMRGITGRRLRRRP